MCGAGFRIQKVHEGYGMNEGDEAKGLKNEPQIRKLPSDFFVLAVKE